MAGPLLIIARYDEQPFESPWEQRVIQKGLDVPNVGREASSYHWWISRHWDEIDPAETYGFVQGDPAAHHVHARNLREVPRYTPLGTYRVSCDWEGNPHHPGLPLSRLWEKWRIREYKPDILRFVSGANFLVPGWDLRSRPRAWYADMYDEMCQEPEAPWCMERFWPYVWKRS